MTVSTLVSVEDYFEQLKASDVKLEYNAGTIVAMAGAQPVHNIITANFIAEIALCLKKKGCRIFTSDQLVKLEACNKYSFPDLTIVCQKPIYEKSSQGLDALLNPEIIVEVLSESTAAYDRTEKFDCYRTLPSFREYVLVSSDKKYVEVHKKLNEAEWLIHFYTEKDTTVQIGDCAIFLDDIYYAVEFE